MAQASNQVTINRPPSEVYAFLADGLNNPKWRSGVVDIMLKSGQPGAVGTEYAQKLHGPGGRTIDGDYRITEAEEDHLLAFVVTAGPARPEGRYLLQAEGNATKVQFSLQFEPKGLMKLMSPMIQKTMNAEVGGLTNLKKVLERA